MDYTSSSSKASEHDESEAFDNIFVYFKKVLKNWWIVVIAAVVFAATGFLIAKVTYTPSYSSKIMFIANNRSSALSVSSGQSASDLNASATLAESFKYVFTTTELSEKVANNSGYKNISVSDLRSWVSVQSVEETAIINLFVKTPNADVSYGIAKAYVDNYEETAKAAFPNTTLTVIDPPLLPQAPDANNNNVIYTFLGFLIGAILSTLAIVAVVAIKDTIKSSDEVKEKLGLKVLGSVSRINVKKNKSNAPKSLLITDRKSGFSFVETYKIMRTKLEHIATREGYKTFVITSTAENEGKTTNATNLALVLAKNGKSVLLIDGDLRKPAVAKTLGINASDDNGVFGVINGEKTLAEAIKYSEKYNLFLLISGKEIFDPSELLSTDAMADIIKSAEKEFDYIIIDTAPCGVVADAAILANYADAILLVVREDVAPARRIKKAMENLENSGTELVGCIYNGTSAGFTKRLSSGSYGSKYGYGYGYGYSMKSKK